MSDVNLQLIRAIVSQEFKKIIVEELRSMLEIAFGDASPNSRQYMTEKQAAEYLGICVQSVRTLRASGRVKCIKFGEAQQSQLRYRKQDLDEGMAAMVSKARRPSDVEAESETLNAEAEEFARQSLERKKIQDQRRLERMRRGG